MSQRFGHIRYLKYSGDCCDNMDEDFVDNFDVRTMANLIWKPLSDGHLRYPIVHQPSEWVHPSQVVVKCVVCITGPDGSIVHLKQEGKKGSKIRVRQQSCFVCCIYSSKTINTQ
jgi:hypothetical protein